MTLATRRRLATASVAAIAVAGAVAAPAAASAHLPSGHHAAPSHGHHHPTKPSAPSVKTASLLTGQYQSSYSARNHLLWVTSAVGRPPVTNSKLTAVDPRTLTVKKTITPPVTDESTGALEAVYGAAVDDEHNNVWVTNTRNNSVAVYNQKTGAHLATLPDVGHSREVAVDERHDLAWATGNGDGSVVAFSTRTLKEVKRFTLDGSSPAGIAVDERTGNAYATDLAGNRIIEVNAASDAIRLIPTGEGPISIALSKDGRTAYTADQGGGSVTAVDVVRGVTGKSLATGEGALSVAVDPKSGEVVVANRTAATLTVADKALRKVVATVPTNANPNHVEFGGGNGWVLDKSGAGANGEDTLYRVSLR